VNDATDKPVSMRKTTGKPAADAGGASIPRPTTVVAMAAVMLIGGLAAIATGLSLHGQHAYLVRSGTKNSPPVSITLAEKSADAVRTSITKGLTPSVGKTLTATQISTQGDKAGDAIDDALPSKNISKNDLKDQKKKAKTALADALKSNTTLTAAQVKTAASTVATKVDDNLNALRPKQVKDIDNRADKLPRSQVIAGIVLTVALGFVAFGAYAGRYWSRWAVPVIWVLCSFTGTSAGIYSLLQLGGDAPAGYKAASGISAAALIVAVVLSFVTPSRRWFEAHKPAVPAGAPQRRGLFAPRVPPPSGNGAGGRGAAGGRAPAGRAAAGGAAGGKQGQPTAANGAKRASSAPDRARTKQRTAPSDAPAAPATPVAPANRTRPRTASKSRRTES